MASSDATVVQGLGWRWQCLLVQKWSRPGCLSSRQTCVPATRCMLPLHTGMTVISQPACHPYDVRCFPRLQIISAASARMEGLLFCYAPSIETIFLSMVQRHPRAKHNNLTRLPPFGTRRCRLLFPLPAHGSGHDQNHYGHFWFFWSLQ